MIQEIVSTLSDEYLKESIKELKEFSETGILVNGKVRALSLKFQELGISSGDSRTLAVTMILEVGAYKWAGIL